MAFDVGSAVGYLLLDTSGFVKGFRSAGKELDSFGKSASSKLNAVGNTLSSVGSTLTKTVTVPMLGIGGTAVKTAATFESAMSTVQATLGVTSDSVDQLDGSTVNVMGSLSDLAKQLGASTKFSAVEAAEAINNMAMAGYSVQEIYSTLPSVLSLASAGALDLDYATQLVANGLNVMGMSSEDATELADKLAVTATKAYGSVSDFGEGLLVAGAQAKLANVSLTDTMTALGILGDNGISASEGGTYLRNTLKNLYTPTEDAAKALAELGIETANNDGTLRDFQLVLQDLGAALDNLTPDERIKAMSRIFDTRTISAANALIENSGERWNELSSSIDNASGSAENMADTQLDNLNGQLTILKSSLEGLAIAFGDLILPVIKQVTGVIQNVVDYLNNLDTAQKEQIVRIAAIVAAIGPALIIVGKIVSFIGTLSKVFSLVASPVGIVVTLVAALAAGFIYLWNNCEGFRDFFINMWNAIKTTVSTVADWFVATWTSVSNWFTITWDRISDVVSSVSNWFTTAWGDVSDWFVNLWGGVSSFFEGLWNSITGFFIDAWDSIVSTWTDSAEWFSSNVIEPIKSFFSPLVDWFVELFTSLWTSIESIFAVIVELARGCVTAITLIWGIVSEWFNTNVIQPVLDFFTGLWNTIQTAASAAWEAIQLIWSKVSSWFSSTVLSPLQNAFTTAWNAVKLGASNTWEGIKTAWSKASSWFSASVLTPLKNNFSVAWNSLKLGGSNAWEAIKNVFSKVPDWFREKFSVAWQKVKDVFSTGGAVFTGITEGITAAFKQVVNAIIGGINQVVAVPFNALNSALDKLRVLTIAGVQPFGFLPSLAVPQIPLLAQGGVLKKGQIGLLEGSGAEAVVPLEKNTGWIQRISEELFSKLKGLMQDSGILDSLQEISSLAENLFSTVTRESTETRSNQVVNNYYTFYSPKEIDPIQARKLMMQTAQQLSLN